MNLEGKIRDENDRNNEDNPIPDQLLEEYLKLLNEIEALESEIETDQNEDDSNNNAMINFEDDSKADEQVTLFLFCISVCFLFMSTFFLVWRCQFLYVYSLMF